MQLAMVISLMIRFNVGTAFLCMVNDGSDNTTGSSGNNNYSSEAEVPAGLTENMTPAVR